MSPATSQLREYTSFPTVELFPQVLARFCIGALIVISVTVPPISLSENLPYVKAEQILLPVVFVSYAWLLLAGFTRLIRLNSLVVVAALFSFSILLSLWYGSAILGHTVVVRDFYEVPKVWLPVAFFTIAYEADLSETSLRRVLSVFAGAILLVCLYGFAQYTNLSFTYRLNPYYTGGGHIDRALQYAGRIYSTMGNPNVLGQLMTWSLVAFSMAAIFRVGNLARNIGLAFACLITLAMTGSRFGLVISTLGLLMVLVIPTTSRKGRVAQMSLLLFMIPVFAGTFQFAASINRPILERFETLKRPLEVDSLRSRVDDLWRDAADDFAQSPIFGHGSAKVIYTEIVTDSEYWDVLKEFGIVGSLCYLGYYLFPLFLMANGLRAGRRAGPFLEECMPATFLVTRLGVIMVVTALLMNIAMTTFYNELLQGFLWLWMGLAARAGRTIHMLAGKKLTNDRSGLESDP